jgi:hypothetical protein
VAVSEGGKEEEEEEKKVKILQIFLTAIRMDYVGGGGREREREWQKGWWWWWGGERERWGVEARVVPEKVSIRKEEPKEYSECDQGGLENGVVVNGLQPN